MGVKTLARGATASSLTASNASWMIARSTIQGLCPRPAMTAMLMAMSASTSAKTTSIASHSNDRATGLPPPSAKSTATAIEPAATRAAETGTNTPLKESLRTSSSKPAAIAG